MNIQENEGLDDDFQSKREQEDSTSNDNLPEINGVSDEKSLEGRDHKSDEEEDIVQPVGGSISLDSVVDKKLSRSISVTAVEMAKLIDASEAIAKSIVRGHLNKLYFPLKVESGNGGQHYAESMSAITQSIKGSSFEPIFSKKSEVEAKKSAAKGPRSLKRLENNLKAMDEYMKISWPLLFRTVKKQFDSTVQGKFTFQGVTISVQPDLVYRCMVDGKKVVGVTKFLIRGAGYSKSQCELVANLLYQYAVSVAKDDEVAIPDLCYAVDVHSKSVISSDKNTNQSRGQVIKRLMEYTAVWTDVEKSEFLNG